MPVPSAQEIFRLNPTDFRVLLDSGQLKPATGTIHFYAPSFTYYKNPPQFCSQNGKFPTVSVTGNNCALNCKHCGGEVLKTMHPATTPAQLYELAVELKRCGAEGLLVSGGCLPDGSVPLDGYSVTLGRLKAELGLTVFVHTGIVGAEQAVELKKAGVDAALIDVVGSEETARRTFNCKLRPEDYADSLRALDSAGLRVVPHVIVGLDNGALGGELDALKIILENSHPAGVVIIAFMPIRGTQMAQAKPPSPLDIAKVAAAARIMFPQTPLALGCMRPKGKTRSETDIAALKAGVDAIAFPSAEAIQYAKTSGRKVLFSNFCCAQMYHDFRR